MSEHVIDLAKPKPLNSGKTKMSTNKLTSVTSTKKLTQTKNAFSSVHSQIPPVVRPRRMLTENDRKLYKLSLKRAAIALNLLNQMLQKL